MNRSVCGASLQYWPHADAMAKYLQDITKTLGLNVRYRSRVSEVNSNSDSGGHTVVIQDGARWHCRSAVVVATGMKSGKQEKEKERRRDGEMERHQRRREIKSARNSPLLTQGSPGERYGSERCITSLQHRPQRGSHFSQVARNMLKSAFLDNLRLPSGLHAAPSCEKKVLGVLRG